MDILMDPKIAAYVMRVADAAPPLTEEQRRAIARAFASEHVVSAPRQIRIER